MAVPCNLFTGGKASKCQIPAVVHLGGALFLQICLNFYKLFRKNTRLSVLQPKYLGFSNYVGTPI